MVIHNSGCETDITSFIRFVNFASIYFASIISYFVNDTFNSVRYLRRRLILEVQYIFLPNFEYVYVPTHQTKLHKL